MKKEWYEIYEIISNALVDFHKKCLEKELHPGKEFFTLCTQEEYKEEFFSINPWVEKFENTWEISSIDPLHIFASFNNWKISGDKRRRKLDFYYKVLHQGSSFKDLDRLNNNDIDVFKQFPHIQITRTVSARSYSEQLGIWKFFYEAIENNNIEKFDNILEFYGVAFSSLTIFLFWIKSDSFLPLDKNTTSLLLNINSNCIEEYDYKNYKRLLTPIFNETGGLYRNLAQIAIDYQKHIERLEQKELIVSAREVRDYFRFIGDIGTDLFRKDIVDSSDIHLIEERIKNEELTSEEIKKEIEKEDIRRFSIFAIKPLFGCHKKYRKTLKENKIYYFNKAYTIKDDETITYNPNNDVDIYSLEDDALKVNINTIVGKNGTGKSSLMELLLLTINNLTVSYDPGKFKDLKKIDDMLEVELYIVLGKPYKIVYSQNKAVVYQYERDSNETYKQGLIKENFLKDFFYTIYSNYSIYSLNSAKEGFSWLEKLFHKNDAYQTPVVIEPMRTNGDFNINSIETLGKQRLLYRLLLPFDDEEILKGYRLITETKAAEYMKLELNDRKIKKIQKIVSGIKKKSVQMILEKFQIDISMDVDNLTSDLKSLSAQYIVYKVININETYEDIYGFDVSDNEEFTSFLNAVSKDTSHVTHKLWQAINFYKYFDDLNQFYIQNNTEIDIFDLSEKIEKFAVERNLELIKTLPPAFFEPYFYLFDVKTNQRNIPFDTLSSGEMQSIMTINVIVYHILNIDSVHTNKSKDNKLLMYRNINIVLDEIELYHHPEMQRRFIFNLLDTIKKLEEVNHIKELNIVLVTHSTFILSDIVSSNVLLMGNEDNDIVLPTFASNIHTLLTKSFFMENGLVGKFAKHKIDDLIETLSSPRTLNEKELKESKYLISVIGEPIIKKQLQHMLDSKLIYNIKQNKVERSELVDDLISVINDNDELKKYLLEALNK